MFSKDGKKVPPFHRVIRLTSEIRDIVFPQMTASSSLHSVVIVISVGLWVILKVNLLLECLDLHKIAKRVAVNSCYKLQ